jgi:hypothetical protein
MSLEKPKDYLMAMTVKINGDDSDLQKKLNSAASSIAKWSAAAVAAAGAATAVLVKSGLDNADALSKQSRALGIAATDLQTLKRAANLSGVSAEQLNTALRTMTIGLGQAAQGTGTAKEALQKLGITLEDLKGLSAVEQMELLKSKISNLGSASTQAAVSAELFGSRAALAMANLNTDSLSRAASEMEKFSRLKLTDEQFAAIEKANDDISEVSFLFDNIAMKVAAGFAPALSTVAELTGRILMDIVKTFDTLKAQEIEVKDIQTATQKLNLLQGEYKEAKESVFGITQKETLQYKSQIKELQKTISKAAEKAGISEQDVKFATDVIKKEEERGSVIKDYARWGGQYAEDYKNHLADLEKAKAITEQINAAMASNGDLPDLSKVKQQNAEPNVNNKDLEALQKRLKSEQELLAENYNVDVQLLKDAQAAKLISEREYQNLSLKLKEEYGEKLKEANANSDKLGEETKQRLEELQNRFKDEDILLIEKYAKDLETLVAAQEQKLITEDEFNALMLERNQKYEDDLTKITEDAAKARENIEKAEMQAKLNMAKSVLGNITSLMGSESRKAFEIQKTASLAEATVAGINSIVQAYKNGQSIGGPMGPAIGAAYAAAAALTTGVQIQKIKSTQFGGGGGDGGAAPATPPAAVPTQQQPERQVANISLQGSMFSRDSVIGLMEEMNGLLADGVRLNVT